MSLVRYRKIRIRASLFQEMGNSLRQLIKRLRAKAVRTPEEETALTIFLTQHTVLDAQVLILKRRLSMVKADLEASIRKARAR